MTPILVEAVKEVKTKENEALRKNNNNLESRLKIELKKCLIL